MGDTIKGQVTNIVDGDTFDMKVTQRGTSNEHKYDDSERIRIADIDEPELNEPGGSRSKEILYRKLKGRDVLCDVQSRDSYGRVVSVVKLL